MTSINLGNVTNTENVQPYNMWNTDSWLFHFIVPIATVAFIWGRRGLLTKILTQFDKIYFTNLCSAISKKDRLLKWIHSRIIFTGSIQDFWTDGRQFCSLINSAIPGACTNPDRHWKKPAKHGQALAFKYLGVVPIFTEPDFEKQKMSQIMENKFIDYLIQIQQVMCKIAVPHQNELKITSNYLARGMGLIAGDEKRKNTFYIYRNTTTFVDSDNIFISIRGPYNSYGRTSIQSFVNNPRKYKSNPNVTKTSPSNKAFFKTFHLNTLINNKAQDKNDIPINIDFETNRAKITFIPQNAGVYEICLITNGSHLMGSPYNVQVLKNLTGIVDTFNNESKDMSPKKNLLKKRVISRVINFVDEQMSYEEYENYKKSCMDKVIKDHEMLIEKERRDSSIAEDFKIFNGLTGNVKNEFEKESSIEEYEIISSNDESEGSGRIVEKLKHQYEAIDETTLECSIQDNNNNVRCLSTEELRNEIQIKKMNFLNSTLSDSESIISSVIIADTSDKSYQSSEKSDNDGCTSNGIKIDKEASPVCNNHIEQEVHSTNNKAVFSEEFPHPIKDVKRTVQEKRKNLKKSHHLNCIQNEITLKETSSFDSEQTTESISTDDNRMRILSVLECLKRDNSYNYITSSLPNLSNNEDVISDNYRIRSHSLDINEICSIRAAYKERKAYWLKLLDDHKSSAPELDKHNVPNERSRKNIRRMTLPNKIKLNCMFSYSANDVSSHAKEKSSYTKNENLTFPSIKERKAIFSSENNINENRYYKRKIEDRSICSSSNSDTTDSIKDTIKFSNESRRQSNGSQDFPKYKENMKERFLKAQNFFQNLEPSKVTSKITKATKRQIA